MSKSIKVSGEVYTKLRELQRRRETYSELIQRLLFMFEVLKRAEPMIREKQTELQELSVPYFDAKKMD